MLYDADIYFCHVKLLLGIVLLSYLFLLCIIMMLNWSLLQWVTFMWFIRWKNYYFSREKSFQTFHGQTKSCKSCQLSWGRLANFEVSNLSSSVLVWYFIYVSCTQTTLLDSKEFLAQVIPSFEAMLAFNRYEEFITKISPLATFKYSFCSTSSIALGSKIMIIL